MHGELNMISQDELIKKYGPLTTCSIDERYWAVNGKYIAEAWKAKYTDLQSRVNRLYKALIDDGYDLSKTKIQF